MNIFTQIDAFADRHNLFSSGQTIIVGLSGGPDSVFLLHYLLSKKSLLNLKIIAAHLNHEWRDSAKVDENFCAQLCQRLKVPLVSKKLSELNLTVKPSGSKEQDARIARRTFFTHLAHEYGANTIALAHHKDDQEETFFIRLFRGSSLSGLTCMQPMHTPYIRPLLCISKQNILGWLAEHTIKYATDPTNESLDFLRNRIRHKLIPLLNEIDSRFSNSFTHTLERLQDTEHFLTRLTEKTFTEIALFDTTRNSYTIQKKLFLALDPVMQYRIIVHWLSLEKAIFPTTQAFFNEIIRFIQQPENKSHTLCPTWKLTKIKNVLHIIKTAKYPLKTPAVDTFQK